METEIERWFARSVYFWVVLILFYHYYGNLTSLQGLKNILYVALVWRLRDLETHGTIMGKRMRIQALLLTILLTFSSFSSYLNCGINRTLFIIDTNLELSWYSNCTSSTWIFFKYLPFHLHLPPPPSPTLSLSLSLSLSFSLSLFFSLSLSFSFSLFFSFVSLTLPPISMFPSQSFILSSVVLSFSLSALFFISLNSLAFFSPVLMFQIYFLPFHLLHIIWLRTHTHEL